MSYYPPPNGSGTTYPYSAYHPQAAGSYSGHPQTPGAYPTTPYQPYPGTAVTGYGAWPYAYSYFPQQQATHAPLATQPKPPVSQAASSSATTSTISAAPSPAPTAQVQHQKVTSTPTTYTFTPSYTRESTSNVGSGARGRKQASFKGLFSKECTYAQRSRALHSTSLNSIQCGA